jgi:hypothetical protein
MVLGDLNAGPPLWGRILTVDNFRKRGFTPVNWCCLCKKNDKTVNHLLIYCEYTNNL